MPALPPRKLHQQLLDLIFPPRCVGCSRTGTWICRRCWRTVAWLSPSACPACGSPAAGGVLCGVCRNRAAGSGLPAPIHFRAVARYAGVARNAVFELKYTQHYDVATVLGPLMADRLVSPAVILVPVPLHRSTRRSRGYNQAELLARQISRRTGSPVVTDRLLRCRKTQDQINLDGAERRRNVLGAFGWRGDALAGRIVLIDDVYTTGATLNACAEALHSAGVRSVEALVFACTPRAPGRMPYRPGGPNHRG